MNLPFFLAFRFLFSRHRSGFARLLTYLSIGSLAIALSSFVIVMAVMNGFDRDLRERIVSSIGAIRGFSLAGVMSCSPEIEKIILETPGVTAVTPEVRLSAFLRPMSGRAITANSVEAQVVAVPMDRKNLTSPLKAQLLSASSLPDETEILLGSALAEKMGVDAGDTVEALLMISAGMNSSGLPEIPARAEFRVSGLYRTGYYEVDAAGAFISSSAAQKLFGLTADYAHTIEIGIERSDRAAEAADALEKELGERGFYFRSWMDLRSALFRAVKLEKLVMALILSLFGLVAVFSVLSALTATAVEKRRELAALRAMGMTRAATSRLFVCAGAIAGGIGVAIGSALSVAGHLLITQSPWFRLPSDIYDLDRLPSLWSSEFLLGAALALWTLAVLSSLVPAIVESRKSPSEALRSE